MERLLIINPGSTSTKIAVYEDETQVFVESIPHSTEDLKPFDSISSQYEFRKKLVLESLARNGCATDSLTCVVGRGGALPPIKAGAYEVNEDMVWQLRNAPMVEHASNLGALIAYEIAKPLGIPAYIYDAVGVDEMPKLNKLTGWKELERNGTGHNLNMRATAIRYAKDQGKDYRDITVVVAHLGGGFTVSLHHKGRIIDVANSENGSFSPERAGALPMTQFVQLIFREGWDENTVLRRMKNQGGLVSHMGTNDSLEVEKLALAGDEHAKLVNEAMALDLSKDIVRMFPVVNGEVEAVLLTGGIARSALLTGMIKERLAYLCPIYIYAGENEMLSLALGGLRVLRGEETARDYERVQP